VTSFCDLDRKQARAHRLTCQYPISCFAGRTARSDRWRKAERRFRVREAFRIYLSLHPSQGFPSEPLVCSSISCRQDTFTQWTVPVWCRSRARRRHLIFDLLSENSRFGRIFLPDMTRSPLRPALDDVVAQTFRRAFPISSSCASFFPAFFDNAIGKQFQLGLFRSVRIFFSFFLL